MVMIFMHATLDDSFLSLYSAAFDSCPYCTLTQETAESTLTKNLGVDFLESVFTVRPSPIVCGSEIPATFPFNAQTLNYSTSRTNKKKTYFCSNSQRKHIFQRSRAIPVFARTDKNLSSVGLERKRHSQGKRERADRQRRERIPEKPGTSRLSQFFHYFFVLTFKFRTKYEN